MMRRLPLGLPDYMALEYETVVNEDTATDGSPCYVARHPELPGCMSHGATPEEAVANLREARELYIRSLLEDGLDVPLPAQSEAATPGVGGA